MLAVGRALMAKPKLIMMDEPSLGLAPIVVRGIFEIIREINRQGITVLLIEQNANMALKIADWAYVMQTGSILMRRTAHKKSLFFEKSAIFLHIVYKCFTNHPNKGAIISIIETKRK